MNSNLRSISHCFWNTATYSLKLENRQFFSSRSRWLFSSQFLVTLHGSRNWSLHRSWQWRLCDSSFCVVLIGSQVVTDRQHGRLCHSSLHSIIWHSEGRRTFPPGPVNRERFPPRSFPQPGRFPMLFEYLGL